MAHALTRTHFIAPKELIEETDRLVGARRRSQFIAEAVAEKLKREKLLQATHKAMALPPVDDVPEWVLRFPFHEKVICKLVPLPESNC